MKENNMINRWTIFKKLLVLLVVILILFASINAFWFFGYKNRFNNIAKHLETIYINEVEEADSLRYMKEIGNHTISLKMPEYLGSGGFISIGSTTGYITELDSEGKIIGGSGMDITLFIWPEYFENYKIGLDFYDELNSVWEQVELTTEMEILNADTMDSAYVDYITQMISTYKDEIAELVDLAKKELGITIQLD